MSILSSDVNHLEGFLNDWLGQILNITVQVVGISLVMLAINGNSRSLDSYRCPC